MDVKIVNLDTFASYAPPDSLSGKLGDKPWNCTYDVYNGKWLNIENYINKILNDDNTNQSSVLHVGGCRTGVF